MGSNKSWVKSRKGVRSQGMWVTGFEQSEENEDLSRSFLRSSPGEKGMHSEVVSLSTLTGLLTLTGDFTTVSDLTSRDSDVNYGKFKIRDESLGNYESKSALRDIDKAIEMLMEKLGQHSSP